ncbi:beta-1,6-N-acetylglucosaminyltransferase [Paracoccus sulfuroxidans]|uniref:Peptide O-xylosyltransferase n=1 Tax=Paracoccus sulfuroxidans TaxID=384678 RepID=A0A562NQ64_9RHOB|nr:beta-1,6-N-acetylglucosaminyltransferase [Paracoccus sulfuroxidans]TWI34347.1 core-2/I-Branching enzyme [Paracoccus sulfuroxidans]
MSGDAPIRLGTIMLCHNELGIAARMARTWAEQEVAVAVHVDRKTQGAQVDQMRAELSDLPNVIFSRRRVCEWGRFSLVQATQDAASALLQQFPDLTHVMVVSGSCLPLRPIQDLRAFLALHPNRDFIESVTAEDVGWTVGGLNEERFTLRFPFSYTRHRQLFDRYVDLQRRLRYRRRIPQGLVPHLGSQWWCLTRATLTAILDDPRRSEYDHYFSRVWIPDESYFQTLARHHSCSIESRSLTLSKFDGQGKPYVFYDDHCQILEESRCFVARKIWPLAEGLYRHFPRPVEDQPSPAEPQPLRLDRLVNMAVARRNQGRPGLYMQSRFPHMNHESGKTAAPYALMQGFADLFPDFEDWLATRVDADVHGHLFALHGAEFAGRGAIGPGGLPDSAQMRDLDPRGFLANLVRSTARTQIWQYSPRDEQTLNWFVATDPNATQFVITGAWAVPLLYSGMPFDDIRRVAAILQRTELEQMRIMNSVWQKARTHIWTLADFAARPAGVLSQTLRQLGGDGEAVTELPQMRDLQGMGRFLQRLRNAGLQPQLMGDFPATDDGPAAERES